jgi:hypothetical protein
MTTVARNFSPISPVVCLIHVENMLQVCVGFVQLLVLLIGYRPSHRLLTRL